MQLITARHPDYGQSPFHRPRINAVVLPKRPSRLPGASDVRSTSLAAGATRSAMRTTLPCSLPRGNRPSPKVVEGSRRKSDLTLHGMDPREMARPAGLVPIPDEPASRDVPEDGRGGPTDARPLARPAGLEPATPGLEGRIPVWEATPLQQVARTATRMCHASDLPRVNCEPCTNPASTHID